MESHFARTRTCLFVLLLPCLLWHSSSIAETPDPVSVIRTALEKLDATNLDDDWHFTMEVVEGDEVQIIRSDPRRDKYQKRQLLTVNGVGPDSERQKEFRETEVDRIDALDPDAAGYGYMVDTATLQPLENTGRYAKLSFVPKIKAMEESRDLLRGAVLLNLETQQIEEIEISNTEKLSPAFSVTVDTYRLLLKFQQEQGEILLSKLESHAAGSAGFLKSFDNRVVVDFSDYHRADP